MGHRRRHPLRATGWRLELLASLVDYNAMRPGIVQTFSALLGESVTEGHPAREFFTRRYVQVRGSMADVLRDEYGDRLPGGLTPEQAAPLLVAVLDGLQYQWLLDPGAVDMPEAFRDFLRLLRPDAPDGPTARHARRLSVAQRARPSVTPSPMSTEPMPRLRTFCHRSIAVRSCSCEKNSATSANQPRWAADMKSP